MEKTMQMIIGVGGRKFFATIGCGVVTSILCAFGKITGEVYAAVVIGTVGAYITGNVVQEIKSAARDD